MTKNKFLSILAVISMSGISVWAADFKKSETSIFPSPRAVHNSDERMPHIGLMIGSTKPEGRFDASGEFGIDIGYQPYVPFGLGLEATFSELKSELTDKKIERGTVLAKLTYNLGGNIVVLRDSYVGVGVGAAIVDNPSIHQHVGL